MNENFDKIVKMINEMAPGKAQEIYLDAEGAGGVILETIEIPFAYEDGMIFFSEENLEILGRDYA